MLIQIVFITKQLCHFTKFLKITLDRATPLEVLGLIFEMKGLTMLLVLFVKHF